MDHRDVAARRHKWWDGLDEGRLLAHVLIENEDGEELSVTVPIKFEVCPTCRGRGSHVNPSIDSHGISREEFDTDPDFCRDYMRGVYDVNCYECGGKRVVPVLDEEGCSPEIVEAINDRIHWEADYARERAWEVERGC